MTAPPVGFGLMTRAGGMDFERDVRRVNNDFGDCKIDSIEDAIQEEKEIVS